jgi:hypothetical protein
MGLSDLPSVLGVDYYYARELALSGAITTIERTLENGEVRRYTWPGAIAAFFARLEHEAQTAPPARRRGRPPKYRGSQEAAERANGRRPL